MVEIPDDNRKQVAHHSLDILRTERFDVPNLASLANLSRSDLWNTDDLTKSHGRQSKEAVKHKSYVSGNSTVLLKARANQA